MPPLYRMLEVCVYSLTNFLPFLAMALYPFRRRLRFSPAVAAALVAVLTLLQMGLGLCAAFFTPGRASLLSAVSTGLYAVFYFLAVRAYPGKTLFTLLMISNLANLVVIAAKCLEGQLFPALAVQSYRWSFALMMLAVEAVLFLPLLLYVRKVYTPAVEQETSGLAWRYLWLIPATFYLIWYYVIYGNTNLTGLEIALRPSSTIVLLFINTGAALVYYVVARLVLEQEKLVALQQKNYALAMQSLQYENLQERIARGPAGQARCAPPHRAAAGLPPAEGLRRHAGVSGSVSGDAARRPAAAILRQCRRQCRTVLLCPAGGGPAGGVLREGPAAGVYRRR